MSANTQKHTISIHAPSTYRTGTASYRTRESALWVAQTLAARNINGYVLVWCGAALIARYDATGT